MKLCISNIAWKKEEENEALEILKKHDVFAIDIALTNVFDSLDDLTDDMIDEKKKEYLEKGFSLSGMQSLLYGIPPYSLFNNEEEREKITNHLEKVFSISQKLGIKNLVFGSPKNRYINEENQENSQIAIDFFRELCEIGGKYDIIICLEANPKDYGCNFITNTYEAIEFIEEVNKENLRLNFDTSTVILNKNNFEEVLKVAKDYISHIHISAPFLMDIDNMNHELIFKELNKINYDGFVCLELKNGIIDNNLENLKKNIKLFVKNYSGKS